MVNMKRVVCSLVYAGFFARTVPCALGLHGDNMGLTDECDTSGASADYSEALR